VGISGCSPNKKHSHRPLTKRYACVHMGTVWESLAEKELSLPLLFPSYFSDSFFESINSLLLP